MLKEKNPLLKLNIKSKKETITNLNDNYFEGLFLLYDFILENPIENFWYECNNIIISYLQLISFSFDESVR